jgi:hypothetical protein
VLAEKDVEEVLIDLMTDRVMSMSTGIQASSMRGLPASPSTACGADHLDHPMKREPSTGMI